MINVFYIIICLTGIMLSYQFAGLPGIVAFGIGILVGVSFMIEREENRKRGK